MVRLGRRPTAVGIVICLLGCLMVVFGIALVDSRGRVLLRNTLLLSAGACWLALPIGSLLACLLARTDTRAKRLGWAAVTAMLFIPLYLQAAGWDAGFGRQ